MHAQKGRTYYLQDGVLYARRIGYTGPPQRVVPWSELPLAAEDTNGSPIALSHLGTLAASFVRAGLDKHVALRLACDVVHECQCPDCSERRVVKRGHVRQKPITSN